MSSSAIRSRATARAAASTARSADDARAAHRALVTLWCAWLVLMTEVNLATPLYPVYAKRFGFSSLVLTVIFAVYALVRRRGRCKMLAPADRRGELTAAFVCCIYLVVAAAVIGSGVVDLVLSFSGAVATIAVALGVVATAAALWQLRAARST